MFIRKAEKRLHRFYMSEVLMNRVLEPAKAAAKHLYPLRILGRAIDSTGIMFRLDDKHAGIGHQYVVNFGGTVAGGKRNMMHEFVRAVKTCGYRVRQRRLPRTHAAGHHPAEQ